MREFFVLHRMVGRRGVLTPGYFEQCNFPSFQTLRNIYKKRKRDGPCQCSGFLRADECSGVCGLGGRKSKALSVDFLF